MLRVRASHEQPVLAPDRVGLLAFGGTSPAHTVHSAFCVISVFMHLSIRCIGRHLNSRVVRCYAWLKQTSGGGRVCVCAMYASAMLVKGWARGPASMLLSTVASQQPFISPLAPLGDIARIWCGALWVAFGLAVRIARPPRTRPVKLQCGAMVYFRIRALALAKCSWVMAIIPIRR